MSHKEEISHYIDFVRVWYGYDTDPEPEAVADDRLMRLSFGPSRGRCQVRIWPCVVLVMGILLVDGWIGGFEVKVNIWEMYVPSRDDVMIQSSWKPSQQIGSSPTTLDYIGY